MRKKRIELPVELLELEPNSYHLLVAVLINGISGDFIIDTGASVTVTDSTLFPGITPIEHNMELQSGSINGEISQVQLIPVEKFEIGPYPLNETQIAAIDLGYVNEMYGKHLNRKITGLLGSDFCVRYNAIIDYRKQTLSLKI